MGWLYGGPDTPEGGPGGYGPAGTPGSRAGGGPPSIDEMDMLLPEPVRGRDSRAGSWRSLGNAFGGPIATGGARGGGMP